jgi:hypothetical protein
MPKTLPLIASEYLHNAGNVALAFQHADGCEEPIAYMVEHPDAKATAAFIVNCVNNHHNLVEALKLAISKDMLSGETLDAAKAAINQVEG